MDIVSITGQVLFTAAVNTTKDLLIEAVRRGANLYGADLRGADDEVKKIAEFRAFTSSLYPYTVQAVLFDDGTRMVRMGCLNKTLAEWKKVGIRKSNLSEFPDDGSDKSEERVMLFELARKTAMRMKLKAAPVKAKKGSEVA